MLEAFTSSKSRGHVKHFAKQHRCTPARQLWMPSYLHIRVRRAFGSTSTHRKRHASLLSQHMSAAGVSARRQRVINRSKQI